MCCCYSCCCCHHCCRLLSGFHEFAEFVAEDVGTVDSGLNSMVLANNNELVLLPVNEPTFGTKRKSQIQVCVFCICVCVCVKMCS